MLFSLIPETYVKNAINVNDEKTITADVYINTLRDLAWKASVFPHLGKEQLLYGITIVDFIRVLKILFLDLVMHLLEKWILLVEGY